MMGSFLLDNILEYSNKMPLEGSKSSLIGLSIAGSGQCACNGIFLKTIISGKANNLEINLLTKTFRLWKH